MPDFRVAGDVSRLWPFGTTSGEEQDGPRGERRVALFVDGPNVLREEFDVDLDDVRRVAGANGRLVVARLYLDEHATPGLIQAGEARGFEVTVTSGDVDVKLATDAAAVAAEGAADVLAIASRDTDFKPVLEAAASRGLFTLAIAPGEYGRSDALANAANDAVVIGGDAEGDTTAETDAVDTDSPRRERTDAETDRDRHGR